MDIVERLSLKGFSLLVRYLGVGKLCGYCLVKGVVRKKSNEEEFYLSFFKRDL